MKKAEFFMIGIAIIVLFMLMLTSFTQTSIQSAHFSTTDEVPPLQDILTAKNSGKFISYCWENQKSIVSTDVGRIRIDNILINSGLCQNNIAIYNSTLEEHPFFVTYGPIPCSIAFDANIGDKFYIMYNQVSECNEALGEDITGAGASFIYDYNTLSEKVQNFCPYSNYYEKGILDVDCTNIGNNKFSIEYHSPDLTYVGVI